MFKRKPPEKTAPELCDINGLPIQEGDTVNCLRYDLGPSTVILDGLQYFYQSKASGTKVSYTKMIDAITGFQKVIKEENQG